ncbi:MAG TPA: alpha/beta hydrolase fold domain-containing protein [Kofleriaceae bacterium]
MIEHPLSERDRAPLAKLLETAAPMKGKGELGPAGRAGFAEMMAHTPAAPDVAYEAATVGGIAGWWCRPAAARPDTAILYLHGGAYVQGSARAFQHLAGQIASRVKAATFIPEYRLGPEHRFPAAFDDAVAAFRGLTESSVALVGDSAGGGLALAILPKVRAKAIAVMSPWADLALASPSMATRAAADPFLTPAALRQAAAMYLGDHDPRDPNASPVYGDHAGLPPVLIHVGDAEILRDDSVRYAETSPRCELHVWSGMPHVFPSSVGMFEASALALDHIGAFIEGAR